MKICTICKAQKELTDFYETKYASSGYKSECKKCTNKINRDAKYRDRYGITWENKEEMIKKQYGKCAICGSVMKKTCVDHNHQTGQIRAILCDECNKGLGAFRDNPEFLRKAAEYLDSWVI